MMRLAVAGCLAAASAHANTTSWSARDEQLVWPGKIEALQRRLTAEDVETRRQAAVELGRLPASSQRRLLPDLFADPDSEVRLAVADAALAVRLPDAGARVSKWLNDPDPRIREAAAEVLSVLRHAGSVPGLGRMLEDPEASVRAAAALALGSSRSADASPFLLGHLDDGDPEVRHAVIEALEDLGDPRAVVPLIGRIQEQRAGLRRQAASALGTLGDPRAASALIVALADGDAGVRAAAATSLGKLRAEDAVWSLGAMLDTEADTDAQGAVLDALGAVGSPSSVEAILRIIGQPRSNMPNARIEQALARAGEVALPALERCVFQPPQPSAVDGCIAALGAIGGPTAAKLIERALRQGDGDTATALAALGRSGQVSVLPSVLEYLTSPAPAERRAAIDAAAQLLTPDRELGMAVEPIVLSLGRAHGSPHEQAALIALLGRTGSPRAAASLIPLANSDNEYLRAVALEALGQLGPAGADSVLLDALDSAHYPTRWTAAVALRRVGSPASLDALLDRFDAAAETQREILAVALAGPLAISPSPLQLDRVLRLVQANTGPIKDALIEALGRVPGPGGVTVLRDLLSRSGKATRAKLAEALGRHPEAAAELVNLAHDSDAAVRANAVWSLGAVGAAESVSLMSASIDDRDIAVAANAAAALALAGHRLHLDVSARLCAALTDSRSYVQANALTGLRLSDASLSCPDAEAPTWLLEHHPSEEVRLAAARLLRERPRPPQGTPDPLARCAAKDVSGRVAAECARTARPLGTPPALIPVEVAVLVVPTGSSSPGSRLPFALVRSDGFIRSGSSDRRGSVLEAFAPVGALRLTLPAAFAE
jgi:HEAT repeat protein